MRARVSTVNQVVINARRAGVTSQMHGTCAVGSHMLFGGRLLVTLGYESIDPTAAGSPLISRNVGGLATAAPVAGSAAGWMNGSDGCPPRL